MYARLRKFRQLRNKSEDEQQPEEQQVYTKVIGNEVYFCADIHEESVSELNQVLRKTQMDLIAKCAVIGIEPPGITLYIHSNGGCVFSGLSGMDHIRSMKIPVTTVVDGVCCSAATILLLGGHSRLMKQNSFVLIHQISNNMWGKFEELKDEMQTVTKLMEHVKHIYKTETCISDSKLKKFMKRDVYLDSSQCLKYGIVSGLLPTFIDKPLPQYKPKDGDDQESD